MKNKTKADKTKQLSSSSEILSEDKTKLKFWKPINSN